VLSDGTNTYQYGLGRLAEKSAAGTEYFLGDALGSVRQLVNDTKVTLTRSYRPYGETLTSAGSGATSYAFTGEWADTYIKLLYLRSRYYAPETGRFITKDMWQGNYTKPMSYNKWLYGDANPIINTDPSGFCSQKGWKGFPFTDELFSIEQCNKLENIYLAAQAGDYSDLPEMQAWYYKLADRVERDGHKQVATNLRHFLDGSGSQLQLSDDFMRNDIWGWGYFRDNVTALLDWYARSKAGGCDPINVGPDIYAKFIDVSQNNLDMWNPLNWPNANEYGALASFRLDVVISGQLQRSGLLNLMTNANLSGQLVALDHYNWHPGNGVTYPGPLPAPLGGSYIPDDWAALLALHGYGRSYYVRGDLYLSHTRDILPSLFGMPAGWFQTRCIGYNFENNGVCWADR
jgi:RHS repeat-associated protein